MSSRVSPRSSRYPRKVAAIFHRPSVGRAAATSASDLARGNLTDDKRLLCKICQSSDGHSHGEEYNLYREKTREKSVEILEEILQHL